MPIWAWLSTNAFNLFSAAGVIGSLLFTAFSLRSETRTRQIANLLSITANHRELWKIFLERKELARVRDTDTSLVDGEVTDSERVFVNLVIQHAHSVYRAMNDHLVVKVEGLKNDVGQFISFPVVSNVWERMKPFQNEDFVAFVDSCRPLRQHSSGKQ